MTIECVTLETLDRFDGNPIAEQHKLRYRTIIQRQSWEVPRIRDLEYDQYDNPATIYLIRRDKTGTARGVSRLYPTDRPFMLKDCFEHMVTYQDMPAGETTLEGSRFCIDNTLDPALRQRIAKEIVVSYLEYGLSAGIDKIIGVMYPVYWHNLFTKNGWEPVWIGDPVTTPDGKKSRAAILPVNEDVMRSVREKTGIYDPVIDFGSDTFTSIENIDNYPAIQAA